MGCTIDYSDTKFAGNTVISATIVGHQKQNHVDSFVINSQHVPKEGDASITILAPFIQREHGKKGLLETFTDHVASDGSNKLHGAMGPAVVHNAEQDATSSDITTPNFAATVIMFALTAFELVDRHLDMTLVSSSSILLSGMPCTTTHRSRW